MELCNHLTLAKTQTSITLNKDKNASTAIIIHVDVNESLLLSIVLDMLIYTLWNVWH